MHQMIVAKPALVRIMEAAEDADDVLTLTEVADEDHLF